MTTPPLPRPQPSGPPEMEVPADLATVYANLVRISHTPTELVFDFAHLLPGLSNPRLCSRIVMSPLGAKLLLRALAENLSHYENVFGEIKIPGEASLADRLFRPPQPPHKDGPAKE